MSEIVGYRAGGRIYHPADVEIIRTPPLTEAEYAATLPERIDRVVAEVNERLADVLPDGVRFEFEPIGDPPEAAR